MLEVQRKTVIEQRGAPGDGGNTCVTCHNNSGSFGNVSIDFEMTNASGAVVDAYKPDSVYSVKISVNNSMGTPAGYGFQMICLDDANDDNISGWSNPSSNAQLSTSAGRNYVEHDGISSTNVFAVDWTAPETATGDVTFYLGANAVNGANGNGGDRAKIDKFTITEAPADTIPTGLSKLENETIGFYPNPVSDVLYARHPDQSKVLIYHVNGALLGERNIEGNQLDVSDLETGIYFFQTHQSIQRILKH